MKNLSPLDASILLVDDNHDGLLVRKALLEEQGYQVEIAANPEDGLKLFKACKYDLVVADYRMPGMNGAELIAEIRKENPAMRVILLSGFVDPLALSEQSTGADAVVTKSFNEPAHLVRSVKRLLNQGARKPPSRAKAALAALRASAR